MRVPKPARFPRTLPWYRSRVIVGSLVSAAAAILAKTGLIHNIAPHDLAEWTDIALTITGVLAAGLVVHSRIDQDTAPRITGGKR